MYNVLYIFVCIYMEGSWPEWCISSMIYSRDTPFWSEILNVCVCVYIYNVFLCACKYVCIYTWGNVCVWMCALCACVHVCVHTGIWKKLTTIRSELSNQYWALFYHFIPTPVALNLFLTIPLRSKSGGVPQCRVCVSHSGPTVDRGDPHHPLCPPQHHHWSPGDFPGMLWSCHS